MSVESAKAFVETMNNDQEFANKINEFKSWEEAKEFIKIAGFDFTQEELKGGSGELTEQELEKVAGGRYNNVCEEWWSGW